MRVISGTARGTQLKTPDGMLTRPTADRVKEALFSILHFDIPGTEVLDLFGGTGQLGIEALSRGSTSATFVDAREDACKLIRENLRRTHMLEKGEVVHMDYLSYLNQCRKRYHIVFLDPPYAETFLENSLKRIAEMIHQIQGLQIWKDGSDDFPQKPVGNYENCNLSGQL